MKGNDEGLTIRRGSVFGIAVQAGWCRIPARAENDRQMMMNHRPDDRVKSALMVAAMCSAALMACGQKETPMDVGKLQELGTKYTAAWCSQDPARVASFFAEGGSLTINEGAPSVGRAAITAAAQGFMTAFPDMVVTMDSVDIEGDHVVYHWTLTGTNTGPGGTGKTVRIGGHEEWTIGPDGLIARSKGHFDEAEYNRQLKGGFKGR